MVERITGVSVLDLLHRNRRRTSFWSCLSEVLRFDRILSSNLRISEAAF
jgi:hypothetical protein